MRAAHIEQVLGQHLAHIRSGTRTPLHVALRLQLVKGRDNGRSRKSVSRRQVARGGQPRSRAQTPIQNRGPQLAIKPATQVSAGVGRGQAQRKCRRRSGHKQKWYGKNTVNGYLQKSNSSLEFLQVPAGLRSIWSGSMGLG